MSIKHYFAIAFIGLGLLFSVGCSTKEKKTQKPNIIYILADDLGYGDLGCYGQDEIRTPHIDQLAKEGIKFSQHYSGSTVCGPSRSVLMTGMHTGTTRIRGNKSVPLQPSDVTVAELLKDAGYVTAQMGKWGLGEAQTTGEPNKQGFDYFVGYLNQIRAHNAYPDWIWKNNDTMHLDNEVQIIPETYAKGIGMVATEKNTHTQDVFTQEAIKFIEQNKDTSFFLYLPYTLPHANNEAGYFDMIGMETPDMMGYDTVSKWNKSQQAFAAAISYLDQDVGKIVSKLKELGLEKNTLVIFTSDNGPHQEGGNDPEITDSNGPLRGLKRDLYEGGIRVPFIAWWPETIEGNRTSDHISAFQDFLPTACELANINAPENIDGISYLPELLGEEQNKHDYLYWEFYEQGGKQAVRFEKWKGVRLNVNENRDAPIELYDLSVDIGEENNVADQFPEVVAKLEQMMQKAHTPSEEFQFE
ncbi:MAG: sulfatase-like hydrolase/transferase [Bacteroidetes bacterium]|jgi:arylsulfatase A-like enzyme|nr:sulfatase-like hydrolase/transferase [Bacteroidota bacterium]